MTDSSTKTRDPLSSQAARFLRQRLDRIVAEWAARVQRLPSGGLLKQSVERGEGVREVRKLFSLILDQMEHPASPVDREVLRQVQAGTSGQGISAGHLERAHLILKRVALDLLRQEYSAPQRDISRMCELVENEIDENRVRVSEAFVQSTQERLRDSVEKYRGFMRTAPEAIFVVRREDGLIVEANDAAARLTGRPIEELVDTPLAELRPEEDAPRWEEVFEQFDQASGPVGLDDARLLHGDGSRIAVDVSATPADFGGQRMALVVARDITEEKELAAQVQLYADQLKRTVQEKVEQVAALTRITTAISAGTDLERIFQIVSFEVGKLFAFDHFSIALLDEAHETFHVASVAGPAETELRDKSVFPLEGSLIDRVASERKVIQQDDLARLEAEAEGKTEGQAPFPEDRLLQAAGVRSYMSVPLLSSNRAIGALILGSNRPRAYSPRDSIALQEIAEQVALSIECARLSEIERKRSAELAIINEVGRKAMSTLDLDEFLQTVAESIQRNFAYFDVSIFLIDPDPNEVELVAQSGAYEEVSLVGYRQPIGVGMVGWAAEHGQTLLANDVTRESRRILAFAEEVAFGSELCVPIHVSDRTVGVINVECTEKNAFDPASVSALETLADLISRTIENARLFDQTRQLKQFNENVIANIPFALIVLARAKPDSQLTAIALNEAFCDFLSVPGSAKPGSAKPSSESVGRPVSQLFSPALLEASELEPRLEQVLRNGGVAHVLNIVDHRPRGHRVLNFHLSRVTSAPEAQVLLLIEDVTEAVERGYRLSMLRQINATVQGTLELEKILRIVLTCVTAGEALGFNRAFLLMVDREQNLLEGRMAVGSASAEDAYRVWQELAERGSSLTELLESVDYTTPREDLPLYDTVRRMVFPLTDEAELVVQTVLLKRPFIVEDGRHDPRVSETFLDLLGANSFVAVPLIAQDEAIGVIIADNLYAGGPVSTERVELLAIFANHAGLAIANGEAYASLKDKIQKLEDAYQTLEETSDKLVQSEKLAAVGEVAARVAHEIRNPLVTIGGFARAVHRALDPASPLAEKTGIIVDEVARLEKILASVMDFTKPTTPRQQPSHPNDLVEQSCLLLSIDLVVRNITLTKQLAPELPPVMVDPEQIKQALLNMMKNAAESIEWGGEITVTTALAKPASRSPARVPSPDDARAAPFVCISIQDTGKGIPPEALKKLFDPFFTTKSDGTGLGLAVTRKIIEDNGGEVKVKSEPGVGTTFVIYLPASGPEAPGFAKPGWLSPPGLIDGSGTGA